MQDYLCRLKEHWVEDVLGLTQGLEDLDALTLNTHQALASKFSFIPPLKRSQVSDALAWTDGSRTLPPLPCFHLPARFPNLLKDSSLTMPKTKCKLPVKLSLTLKAVKDLLHTWTCWLNL